MDEPRGYYASEISHMAISKMLYNFTDKWIFKTKQIKKHSNVNNRSYIQRTNKQLTERRLKQKRESEGD